MLSVEGLMPDLEVVLAMAPADLAPIVLQVANSLSDTGNQRFHPQSLYERELHAGSGLGGPRVPLYNRVRSGEVQNAIDEALQWLEVHLLVMRLGGTNAGTGWMQLTRLGRSMVAPGKFAAFRASSGFPRSMLHPRIAEKVWLSLARGDLDEAVFVAFRAVEEAVREAGGFKPGDFGVGLMRSAFNPNGGPLVERLQPPGEQEALMHLFAGAIGSYKNPHSHRTVALTDLAEAQEQVLLASHLLRIAESRAGRGAP